MHHPPPIPVDLDLLEQIHDVALGRSTWREVLACLKAEFSTEASLLAVFTQGPGLAHSLATTDPDGRRWSLYAAHFAALDPFTAAMHSGLAAPGIVVAGEALVPARAFCRSEYFNDWFRPNGLRYTARGFIGMPDGRYLQFGMPRAPGAGAYTPQELARLQRYFNHITRARLIQEEIQARSAGPDFDQVARTYGLTPAKARLIERLAEAGSLRRAVQGGGQSYFTLRAQLRSVFIKTEVHCQADLMRLIHQHTGEAPPPVHAVPQAARSARSRTVTDRDDLKTGQALESHPPIIANKLR